VCEIGDQRVVERRVTAIAPARERRRETRSGFDGSSTEPIRVRCRTARQSEASSHRGLIARRPHSIASGRTGWNDDAGGVRITSGVETWEVA
jgi:hypothetical protein